MQKISENKLKKCYTTIEEYNGENPYIIKLKKLFKLKLLSTITPNQCDYIIKNKDFIPKDVNKIVDITKYFGEELKKSEELDFIPERIFIEKVIGETEKALHCYVKLTKNGESKLIWFPKFNLNENIFKIEKEVNIDWNKYNNRPPKNYQKEGIEHLLKNDKYILAFDPGCGKSLCGVIGGLESKSEKILIVCPSTLKLNWKHEIMFYDVEKNISVINDKWIVKKWTIINYDKLIKYKKQIINENFDLIISDESHYLKNKTTKRSKIFDQIQSSVKKVWLLTGTPITNKPFDIFNLLRIVEHPITTNWVSFVRTYCNAKQIMVRGRLVYEYSGASNLDELNRRIQTVMLRKRRIDVLSELPDKNIKPIYLEIDEKGYNSAIERYIEWKKKEGKNLSPNNKLVQLSVLRKYVAEEKIKHTKELIDEILENGEKVVIFTCYTEVLNQIFEKYKDIAVKINGETKNEDRQLAVEKFQTDENCKVFVGNIIAAGVGITLTSSRIVIFNDLDWTPANMRQAEDRVMRIGQNRNVVIYYPLFDNTIDTIVYTILGKKKEVIEMTVDGKLESTTSEIIRELEEKLGI
jgi:SWI/SNF-related matrix-associated actin-dependent regulator 1 of chromatin subfamily A